MKWAINVFTCRAFFWLSQSKCFIFFSKIQWFFIWDLPKDRSDMITIERLGMHPSNFRNVVPFVKDLQSYAIARHSELSKSKLKVGEKYMSFSFW